jgi:hypothetical protein
VFFYFIVAIVVFKVVFGERKSRGHHDDFWTRMDGFVPRQVEATLGGTHKFFTANSNICSSSSSRAMMKRDDDDDDGRRTILPNSLSLSLSGPFLRLFLLLISITTSTIE